MVVAMTVTVVIVIMIATVIAVMVVIPFVIVLDTAVRTFPVTVVELFSIVARADPTGTLIRRAAPIAFMPTIVSCGGIPVAANPCKFRTGLFGNHGDEAWLGRPTDTDATDTCALAGIPTSDMEDNKTEDNKVVLMKFLIGRFISWQI